MGDDFRQRCRLILMRKDYHELHQIKPDSVLDPPQIKLSEDEAQRGTISADESVRETGKRRPRFHFKQRSKKEKYAILGGLSALGLFLIFFLILPVVLLVRSGLSMRTGISAINAAVDKQDIGEIKTSLEGFKKDFGSFRSAYSMLAWNKVVPIARTYYIDGEAALSAGSHGLEAADVLIETIEPHAEIIGFGNSAASGDANQRIEFLVQSIEIILPRMDELVQKSGEINKELSKINPKDYPKELGGKPVRAKIKEYLTIVEDATQFLSESKPILESAPYLLGIDGTRTYMLVFQNDKELRPTGGFMTAYSIIQVTNGKIQPGVSSDIYKLDDNYIPQVEAPSALRKYIKGPYIISDKFYLRDMNWNPDFKKSMELFTKEAEAAGIKDIDGVIAVDTEVVVNLLSAIGAVEVPEFGRYSSDNDERCDCPQVVYELESFADVEGPIVWSENEPGKIVFAPPNYLNRKEIVGPLMNTVLTSSLGQPVEKMPALFHAVWKSLTEKHILFYMFDPKVQESTETFGISGRVKDYNDDYFMIVDANLGGRKSNLYVTQEVHQDIEIDKDGSVVKTVTISYQNPQDYDGWLNSVLPNWTRIYIPKGSEILGVDGFDDQEESYEELGKTVIAGGFELRPLGVRKISIKYRLPFKVNDNYNLLIQKQPGKGSPLYSVNVLDNEEEFYLLTDRELKLSI